MLSTNDCAQKAFAIAHTLNILNNWTKIFCFSYMLHRLLSKKLCYLPNAINSAYIPRYVSFFIDPHLLTIAYGVTLPACIDHWICPPSQVFMVTDLMSCENCNTLHEIEILGHSIVTNVYFTDQVIAITHVQ